MEPITLIGAIIAAIGFLAMVAAAVVVVRSSALRTAAETWREEAEAQKARADRLEDSVTDLSKRVEKLEADNTRLQDLATGQTAVADLQALVIRQHTEVVGLVTAALSGHSHG